MFLYIKQILIFAAVIPAIFLLIKVYQADRLEKESPAILISLVLYGILATVLAGAAEQLGQGILSVFAEPGTVFYNAVLFFGIVAFAEEGAKYVLLKKRTWYSPEFNCQFDGVVYAVFVSLGFALWENIGYVFRYGLETALVRAVTAVPGHACFGVFMGIFYGLAKRYAACGQYKRAKSCRALSLLIPALLHGTYDFAASARSAAMTCGFVIFVIAMFVVAFNLVRKMSRNDRYI